jgi:hypothetical protein
LDRRYRVVAVSWPLAGGRLAIRLLCCTIASPRGSVRPPMPALAAMTNYWPIATSAKPMPEVQRNVEQGLHILAIQQQIDQAALGHRSMSPIPG